MKQYIRTEEKDRLHTVNMYEHRRDTDPEEALRIRDSLVNHLKLIDDRIVDAIDMLKRVPDLEKKIRPEIGKSTKCLLYALCVFGVKIERKMVN